MKFRNLFHMVEDAQEICGLFDKVETPEQMVSVLERLKKQAPAELLELIQSLRLSTESILEDTLEPSGPLGEGGDQDEFDDLLGKISSEDEPLAESEKPATTAPAANSNSSGT